MNSNFYQRQTLKTRVTLFTLAIFVMSIWALSFYAGRMLRNDMERMLGEQQSSTAFILGAQIEQGLADRLRALELIADSIDATLLTRPAALQNLLEDRPILQIFFNGGTFATGVDGTAIADFPVVPGRAGTNYIDREAVAVPLKEEKPVIGGPAMGKTLKAPIFSIAVPIRTKRGKVIGALVGTIDLGKRGFLDVIGDGRYGQSGGYMIVDPVHRLFVTATDKNRVMQPLPAPGVNHVLDRRVQGFDGPVVNVNSLGVEVLSSARRIPAAGWFVIAMLPTKEAFAPIREMLQRLLVATALLTLLVAVLTWWMLRRQLAPVLDTLKTLADLSHSDKPPQPLPITKQDEIGDLIGGFNRLLETLRQRDEQVRQLAFYDTLTKLPNRRLFNDRLSQAMAASKRSGCYSAVMFLDLDNFKSINDAHGHVTGDALLIEVAARLKSCVREMDTVARFGGDEFVVMISDLDAEKSEFSKHAGVIAEKIHVALGKPYVLKVQHEDEAETSVRHQCTASIGVVLFGKNEDSQDDILKRADMAMYQAKEAGRNLIRVCDSKAWVAA